jgi:hypothetical protein
MKWTPPCTFGVISDTHGVLRPEVKDAFRGVDGILHAGDIGNRDVLRMLGKVATVVAVEGNVDRDPTATNLPDTEIIGVGRFLIYLIHDLGRLDLDPAAAGIHAVISGHSHQASVETRDSILYFNPGGAGPDRADSKPTVGLLHVAKDGLRAEIVDLPG